MQIREATLEDLEYVHECICKLGEEGHPIRPETSLEYMNGNGLKSDLVKWIVSDKHAIFIGELDGNKLGVVTGEIEEKGLYWKYEKPAYMSFLFVEKSFRKNGYALTFVETFSKWARENGCDKLLISTLGDNTPALKLYEKIGCKVNYLTFSKDL